MVLVSHQFALMGLPKIGPDSSFFPESLGVSIFFIISGYLVTQSWKRDPHIFRFLVRRLLRIWPGLFVATCVAALIIGPLVSSTDAKDYFSSPELREYFLTLRLTQAKFDLPGVFIHNPFPRAVNGSLWTIPLEVHWYLVLALAGLLGVLRWRWLALAGFVGLAVYHFGIYHAETNPVRNWTREYGLFFLAGTLLALFHDERVRYRHAYRIATLIVGALLFVAGGHILGILTATSSLIVDIGEASTPILRQFGRFGDLSYGVYIYAFMVQQTLIARFGTSGSFALHLLASSVVTFICAWLSWHLVEKQALSLKPFGNARGNTLANAV